MTTAIRSLSLGITIAVFELTIPAVDKRRRHCEYRRFAVI
jgi:hypothetical protein